MSKKTILALLKRRIKRTKNNKNKTQSKKSKNKQIITFFF